MPCSESAMGPHLGTGLPTAKRLGLQPPWAWRMPGEVPQPVVPYGHPGRPSPHSDPKPSFPRVHATKDTVVQHTGGTPLSSERKDDSHGHPSSVLSSDTGSRAKSDLSRVSPRTLVPPPPSRPPGQGHTHTSCGRPPVASARPVWPRPQKPPQTQAGGGGQCHCVGILQEHQRPSRHVRSTG